MGVVISLCFGWGLWLVIDGFLYPPRVQQRQGKTTPWAAQLLAEAGAWDTSVRRLWLTSVGAAAAGALVVWLLSGFLVFGVLAAFAASTVPFLLLRSRAARRRREFHEAWPDAVDNLTSAIRAGMSLPEALIALAESGPEVLRPSFQVFAQDYQDTGRFGECLDRLKQRLSDPVGDRIVEALKIAREVGGGDIAHMMRTLSAFLHEDLRTRAELEARQSWTVSGARLAVAAPWAVLLLMSTSSQGLESFTTPVGVSVLVVGAATCVGAYLLMMRLGRLPAEPRVLVA